ncbi:MAG: Asp-tRNA(Asn)/Glu-tRNA(Gln) amidotransferase subunit GatA [Deltaproteobacteria bacterium]|nr:Asp-tRNA(Asn)/Glu-tRNA(Gln) amidotransferase subunit GatA [Deltaproteobacteria bacterium]
MSPTDLSLLELASQLDNKKVTSREATEAQLARVEKVDPRIRAYLHVDRAGALAMADAADARLRAGQKRGPLDGIPVALKDLFNQEGTETTAGSKILKGYVSPYDATVVKRLKAAGAVLLGKLNLDEFAMGSSTENSAFGPTFNPWDVSRTPGGSSGGSSAAVAARLCAGALGTDTGGSIRQPAALCGVVGLKPTYGRVSRYGVVAFASSLDQVGPLARTTADCAAMLQVIAGDDPCDSTSSRRSVPNFSEQLEAGVKGMKLGVPREYFVPGMDAEVERAVRAAIAEYEKLGATIVEVSLPHTQYAVSCYYLIATAEASSNLARYDGVKYGHRTADPKGLLDMYARTRDEGFGAEVKRRIMLGTYALSAGYYDAYYLRAQKVRTLIRRDFDAAFEKVDAIVTPTSPTAAFKIGEKMSDPIQMYLNDIFTLSCNLASLPGMSLPCGFTASGLPIGLQLLGKPWDEATLLRVARAYEREHDWAARKPPEVA